MRAAKAKTESRQEQIAAAALELMARHGPKALNVARLARAVGVVPSAIYRHYSGKDAVLDAVLDLISQRLQENVFYKDPQGIAKIKEDRVNSLSQGIHPSRKKLLREETAARERPTRCLTYMSRSLLRQVRGEDKGTSAEGRCPEVQ